MRLLKKILLSSKTLSKHFNFPFVLLIIFPFYFAYDLYTGNVYFSHNDFPGMYYPFRQWFLGRLKNLEFPIWNPYWGTGHEAVIWSTVPIDPYTILELILGHSYAYFHLIQCFALVMAGYYVFRKLQFLPWTAAICSLLFFMSPLVTCWYFEFINTNTFIAHMFTFLFIIKWFTTGRFLYAFLICWSFFIGMFGTKLEFWFYEFIFFILLSMIAFFIIKPRRLSMVIIVWVSILVAILAQSWQLNLLVNALNNSNRLAIPHGLHNLFSSEMYKNLFLSMGDSELFPLILICIFFFMGLHSNKPLYHWFFMAITVILLLSFRFWKFPFLESFFYSPILYGGLLASVLIIRTISTRYLFSTWILFMLPAYYWGKPLVNFDELYLLREAPVLFQGIWGFFIWLGCLQVHRYKLVQLAYLSIPMVFLLQVQGQIIFSYLFGFLWITGRDNYLIDFSFVIMAAYGTITYFRIKPLLIRLAPFLIVFSAYPNLYYTAPLEPVPGYANPLLNFRLPYDPFKGVPGLKGIIKGWRYIPYRRVVDPDIENRLPQNHGTFLLEHTANATFYGSAVPFRYRELINFYRYGITPDDNVSGYPSTYSGKTISRLPKVNTKGLSNNLIYYSTVWIIPPFDLNLLRLLGVIHIVTRDFGLISSLIDKLKLYNIMKYDEFTTAELSDTLPRVFLVTNVKQKNLEDFQKNMKPQIKLGADLTNSLPNIYIAEPVDILEYKPEYIAIQIKSTSGGYLVLTDVYHSYWSAVINGTEAEIIPAFHAFRAVKIPSGVYKVEFFCKVPYFKLAFSLSFILVIVFLICTLLFHDKTLSSISGML